MDFNTLKVNYFEVKKNKIKFKLVLENINYLINLLFLSIEKFSQIALKRIK